MFDKGLVVFSGKDCPKCVELKTKLKAEGKSFEEFDIWDNSEALQFLMSKGLRSIPQLFSDGVKVDNA